MSREIETTILAGICHYPDVSNTFIPHLKKEHFQEQSSKYLFDIIYDYIQTYDERPSVEALVLEIQKYNVDEDTYDSSKKQLANFKAVKKLSEQYVKDQAKDYVYNRALYNALMESIDLAENGSVDQQHGIPDILTDALTMDFNTEVGMFFFEDAERRWDLYHDAKRKVPFHLDILNKVTKGGAELKTLNIIMAGTNVGKTAMMCDMAAGYMLNGYDVLYITMEMAEEKIYQRIDANIFDITLDELMTLKKDKFMSKVDKLKTDSIGDIAVKEFPTASINTNHIKALIKDMRLKKKFAPTVVMVDYLNLLQSSRYSTQGNNSYTIIKAIAEELRGIAVQNEYLMWSATQLNREGYASSDVDLTHTSESFGLPATADFMFAALTSDQLKANNKMAIRQLKSRYDNVGRYPAFSIGADFDKMKMFDLQNGQGSPSQNPNTNDINQEDVYDKFKARNGRDTSNINV